MKAFYRWQNGGYYGIYTVKNNDDTTQKDIAQKDTKSNGS